MPAGLQILNSFGTFQIDENWKNFGFRQYVDVGFSITLPNLTPYLKYSLVVPGQMAMVAIRASVFYPVLLSSSFDGTNYTFNWELYPPVASGTHAETIRFYVFDVPPSGGFSNVGLEVFNASGERVFHSDVSVMKIAGVLSGADGFTGTPGRAYAPMIAVSPAYKNPGSGRVYARAPRVSGHQIIPEEIITEYVAPFSGDGGFGLYAAIDVTDYP